MTTKKTYRTIGAITAAAIGFALLMRLRRGHRRAPGGWEKLDTKSLSVGYPVDKGYKEQPAAERAKANAAVAVKEEGGLRTGMVSVQLDFATGVDSAAEAASAAGAADRSGGDPQGDRGGAARGCGERP